MGLAVEEVDVLLSHEVLSRVEWIQSIAGERSVHGVLSDLAETSLRWTEYVVRPRRHDRVAAVGLDIVEAVVALSVSDYQA